jgi:hypothetical protein
MEYMMQEIPFNLEVLNYTKYFERNIKPEIVSKDFVLVKKFEKYKSPALCSVFFWAAQNKGRGGLWGPKICTFKIFLRVMEWNQNLKSF